MELSLFDSMLIVLGATVFSCAFMYLVLRLGAWCDGREWWSKLGGGPIRSPIWQIQPERLHNGIQPNGVSAVSFDQSKYIQEFVKESYDRIVVQLPKGKRVLVKEVASKVGLSMNQAVVETIEQAYGLDLSKSEWRWVPMSLEYNTVDEKGKISVNRLIIDAIEAHYHVNSSRLDWHPVNL